MWTRKILVPLIILVTSQVILGALTFGLTALLVDPAWITSTFVDEMFLRTQTPQILLTLTEDIQYGLRDAGLITHAIAIGGALLWLAYSAVSSPYMPTQAKGRMIVWGLIFTAGLALASAQFVRTYMLEGAFSNMRPDRLPLICLGLLSLYFVSFYLLGTLIATRRTLRTAVPLAAQLFNR